MSTQPKWKLVANLGDVNPLDYGGYFVYVDETGVYPPEAELLEVPEEESETGYRSYRFILEPCTFENGVLSDNPYHKDLPAWFAEPESKRADRPQDTTYLKNIADCMDIEELELVRLFCSDSPLERAEAWRAVGDYHGWENLDSYPTDWTREELEARLNEEVQTEEEVKGE